MWRSGLRQRPRWPGFLLHAPYHQRWKPLLLSWRGSLLTLRIWENLSLWCTWQRRSKKLSSARKAGFVLMPLTLFSAVSTLAISSIPSTDYVFLSRWVTARCHHLDKGQNDSRRRTKNSMQKERHFVAAATVDRIWGRRRPEEAPRGCVGVVYC